MALQPGTTEVLGFPKICAMRTTRDGVAPAAAGKDAVPPAAGKDAVAPAAGTDAVAPAAANLDGASSAPAAVAMTCAVKDGPSYGDFLGTSYGSFVGVLTGLGMDGWLFDDGALSFVKDASRKSTVASKCRVFGPGLESAIVRQISAFTIEANTADGSRQAPSCDSFTVGIRLLSGGSSIFHKVFDQKNGSYVVAFRPAQSGKYVIATSLRGKPLPGSPWTCFVSPPRPSVLKCVVQGEALTRAIARVPQTFSISYRDVHGNQAHAEELDVYVTRATGECRGARMTRRLMHIHTCTWAWTCVDVMGDCQVVRMRLHTCVHVHAYTYHTSYICRRLSGRG